MTLVSGFSCQYCHKVYTKEKAYLEHKCKQMMRMEELKTPDGQAAWEYYQMWFRAMKRIPPQPDTFTSSKYFRTFMNFSSFVKRVKLIHPKKFIWLMVEKNYPPTMWMIDEVYVTYLEFLDHKVSPQEHVEQTIDVLFSLADEKNVDISLIFDHVHANELIHLLRTRQISPWFLLHSKKFKQFFIHKTTNEQKDIFETLIQPNTWSIKFQSNQGIVNKIKKYVAELDL